MNACLRWAVMGILLLACSVQAEMKRDIEYGRVGDERLLLDVHVPDGAGPFPIAILVHGGGWSGGDKSGSDQPGNGADITPWFAPLTAAKFTWFSINYRLAPKHRWPACFDDLQTAVRWVKAHAAEFKGDPRRIAIFGHSAGGHLVTLLSTLSKEDTRVQAVVGFAPVTDIEQDLAPRGGLSPSLQQLLNRPKEVTPEALTQLRAMSPINRVRAGMPPTLLLHGDADKTVPLQQSLNFQKRLKSAGVRCELITIKDGPHSLLAWDKHDSRYKAAMVAWLDRTLGAAVVKPDATVSTDGAGDFKTIQAALDAVPRDNRERRIVLVKDGVYREKVRIDAANVTLRGESRGGTRIEFPQGREEFQQQPDRIGFAVVNINGDDCVLEQLTVENTHGVTGKHAFAIYGRGDRTVITDCDVFSQGNDTLSLWNGERGRYYHARLSVRGSVDFVCPRGWCYMVDSDLYEVNPSAEAALWHDGSKNKEQKFVLRNCRLDGVQNWGFLRHHHDAQFFFVDCSFSTAMRDRGPYRVIYPTKGGEPSAADLARNQELERTNRWGERTYFANCHRAGGDFAWHADNLANAPGALQPEQITAAWTFADTWNPERRDGPTISRIEARAGGTAVVFTESVSVKGAPALVFASGARAAYLTGSGTDTVVFGAPAAGADAFARIDVSGGAIVAGEAASALRFAALQLR